MPTLLQINITANWGSTGKIAEAISNAALERGWESYVAYGRYSNPSKAKLIKVGSMLATCLHYAEQRVLDREGLCSRIATRRLIRKIRQIHPDVVQLHNIHDHYLNYRLLFEYLNRTDIRVVWTFHDCWAFTGHCFHFVTADCNRWQTGCHDCPLRHVFPCTVLDRSKRNYALKKSLFSNCRNLTIVACSDWIGDYVKQSFLGDKRVEVIHNGVDLDTFALAASKEPDGKMRLLGVSSVWNKDKGLDDIVFLRRMLPEEYEITLVGLTAEQIGSLPAGIRGIERTQNVSELVGLYSEADVLINPTYADTFPTVNLEALACGTPVITYRTGGSPEAIDEKTGLVVEQGNVEALAAAIRQLKEAPLSTSDCRSRAEKLFDKNRCFEEYVNLYDSLLRR